MSFELRHSLLICIYSFENTLHKCCLRRIDDEFFLSGGIMSVFDWHIPAPDVVGSGYNCDSDPFFAYCASPLVDNETTRLVYSADPLEAQEVSMDLGVR